MSNKLSWLWLTLVTIGCESQIITQPQNIPDSLNDKRTQIVEAITSAERVGVIGIQTPGSIDGNRSQGNEIGETSPEIIDPEGGSNPEEPTPTPLSPTEGTPTTGDTSETENSPEASNQNPEPESLTPEGNNSVDGEDGNGDANGNEEEITTNTTSGTVKGHKWRENANIIGYIDIPYGSISSPFAPPTPVVKLLEIHDEVRHTKKCPQLQDEKSDQLVGDLGCLTLTIFVPANAENASVLFHIHDTHKRSADPDIYGPEHLVAKGIILVLPNYRIGAPGFLCLHNEYVPCNAGLRDLTLALKWVNDNIESFGGNPSKIVVSGEGNGGALVGYLTMYQPSQSYIRRAITESGSVLSPWALDRHPLNTAERLANNIKGESRSNIDTTIESAKLSEIVVAARNIQFAPCIGLNNDLNMNPFMNNTPWHALTDNQIDMTFMIGSASYAGAHEALELTKDKDFIEKLNADFSLIFPEDLIFENDNDKSSYALRVKTQYFGEETVTTDHLKELTLCLTDASYWSPVIRLARPLVEGGSKVYLYEFDFVGQLNNELQIINKPFEGAVRTDIIGYLFKRKDYETEDDSSERIMINLMVDLWTSFIINGEPEAPNLKWTKFTNTAESDEEWLSITSSPQMRKGVHVDRLNLWTKIYEEHYIERSSSTSTVPRNYPVFILGIGFLVLYTKFNY